jgi:hypothetical protein
VDGEGVRLRNDSAFAQNRLGSRSATRGTGAPRE